MNLSNWFKIPYWMALTGLITWLLFHRLDVTAKGDATPFDAVVFVVWVALLLAPIFSEVKIWGISLKQEIEKAKKEASDAKDEILKEVQSVRLDVRNSIQVSPVFNAMQPPPDSQLPAIKAEIEKALSQRLSNFQPSEQTLTQLPTDVEFLFTARFQIETEVRRIAAAFLKDNRLRTQIRAQVTFLMEHEAIPYDIGKAIIEVYRVCSPAVHGEFVTDAQIDLVREVAPKLIETLRKTPPLFPD